MNAHSTTQAASPDMSRVSAYLRRHARFEGEAPPPPATPPVTPPAPNGGNGDAEKKFSKAEVEELIKERVERLAGSERKKLLGELGIEDVATDAELLKAAKAKREADKTEVERLAGEAEKAKAAAEAATVDLERERAERAEERRDNALLAALREQGAKDAELSLIGLKARKADAVKALLGEDGKVDAEKVKTLVTDAKQAYADQFGGKHAGVPGSGSHSGGKLPQQEVPKVRTSGRL